MTNQDDGYGSAFREKMKEVMEKPAAWKPYNHTESCRCTLCHQLKPKQPPIGAILALIAVGLTVGIGSWLLLDHLLRMFR